MSDGKEMSVRFGNLIDRKGRFYFLLKNGIHYSTQKLSIDASVQYLGRNLAFYCLTQKASTVELSFHLWSRERFYNLN
jgi:hypothetical protein